MSVRISDDGVLVADDLVSIRREIDGIDADLLDLIHRRLRLAQATIEVKQREGLASTDGRREAEVVRLAAERARERGLEPELIREIFWRLIELSRTSVRQSAGARAG